jgi:uncharacterized protein
MTGKGFAAVLGATVVLLAAGGIYATVRPDKAHGGPQPSQVITVAGTGIITTTPDRADFSFGVSTDRATAKDALAVTAERMQRIINALKAAGIQARDIQTQQVSIGTRYDSGVIVGYIASNSVIAKVRDIDKAGPVIDSAVDAGATGVWGPSFFRSDQQQLARNALRAAVSDARAKAQALAAASGASVGRVVSVIEHGAISPGGVTGGVAGSTGSSGGIASVPTPVLPGEQSVTATVSVTFAAQ